MSASTSGQHLGNHGKRSPQAVGFEGAGQNTAVGFSLAIMQPDCSSLRPVLLNYKLCYAGACTFNVLSLSEVPDVVIMRSHLCITAKADKQRRSQSEETGRAPASKKSFYSRQKKAPEV